MNDITRVPPPSACTLNDVYAVDQELAKVHGWLTEDQETLAQNKAQCDAEPTSQNCAAITESELALQSDQRKFDDLTKLDPLLYEVADAQASVQANHPAGCWFTLTLGFPIALALTIPMATTCVVNTIQNKLDGESQLKQAQDAVLTFRGQLGTCSTPPLPLILPDDI